MNLHYAECKYEHLGEAGDTRWVPSVGQSRNTVAY